MLQNRTRVSFMLRVKMKFNFVCNSRVNKCKNVFKTYHIVKIPTIKFVPRLLIIV